MSAGIFHRQHAGDGRIDDGAVFFGRTGNTAAARRQLHADGPLFLFKGEETLVFARNGAHREKPYIVGPGKFEAGESDFVFGRKFLRGGPENVILRRAGMTVGKLIFDEFHHVVVCKLDTFAGDENRDGVRVPCTGVLAALERPTDSERVRFHPVYINAPGSIRCVAQGEKRIMLGAVRILPFVLIVVISEFIVLGGMIDVYDRRRPETVGRISRTMRFDGCADIAFHVVHIGFAHLDHLQKLQFVKRAGIVVGENKLPADPAVCAERAGGRV